MHDSSLSDYSANQFQEDHQPKEWLSTSKLLHPLNLSVVKLSGPNHGQTYASFAHYAPSSKPLSLIPSTSLAASKHFSIRTTMVKLSCSFALLNRVWPGLDLSLLLNLRSSKDSLG